MVFTASEDLRTLLFNNFVYTNVTGLTGKPSFRLISADEETDYTTNGEVIIHNEEMINQDNKFAFRDIFYLVDLTISTNEEVTDTTIKLKAFIAEIDRVIKTESRSTGRSYRYRMIYTWNGSLQDSIINCRIEMVEELVS